MWKIKTVAEESPAYSMLLRKTGNALRDHSALGVFFLLFSVELSSERTCLCQRREGKQEADQAT
jgi:hypothetical protein